MKKISLALLICVAITACSSEKDKEKALLNDVIKIHDEVMGKEEKLMQNKMKLDTLLLADSIPVRDPIAEKIIMSAYSAKLVKADGAMEAWMQNFNADQKGKSHEQIMAYFADQKKAVIAVDSQITIAVKGSDEYLAKFKK